jgi:tRNA(adenine34) deaminase
MVLQPAKRFVAGIDVLPAPPPGWDSFEAAMEPALAKAGEAAAAGEAPVGAVVLSPLGEVLATAANSPIALADPTAHAEILALRVAAAKLGNYRLPGSILVVTLEPCLMCLGALIQARVGLVVYGAADPKAGAVDSCLSGPDLPFLNHRFDVVSGVSAEACGRLLTEFFRARRKGSAGPGECPCQYS